MRLGAQQRHHVWDNTIEPAAEIGTSARVELELTESSGGQLSPDSEAADLVDLDFARVNPVTGPLRVEGAEPGDALVVRVRELTVGSWGWTALIPDFGLLARDFAKPALWHSALREGTVRLPFGVSLPLRPMIGTIGVARPEPGAHSLVPPSVWGGNLDIRHITAGATVVLPVAVPGALLSVGDAHAAMGDGEICGTGVETSATAVLDIELVKGAAPRSPVVETAPAAQRTGGALATTGIGPDLLEAAREAARAMVDTLCSRVPALTPQEAYGLCSVTGDLIASQVVDMPNFTVTLHVPAEVVTQLSTQG